MIGWIKLHRQLLESELWKCESFTRGQAWVDLILLANHQDSYFYKRGNKIDVKRGQIGRSEVELSDRWKWSRTKVRKFLNDMEKEQQIIQQKTTVTQILTVVNYDLYQQKEQQSGQQKDSRKTAEKHIQECKEGKNVEEETKGFVSFAKSLQSIGAKKPLINDWLKVRRTKKATNTETAFNGFQTQVEISGKDVNEILELCVNESWSGFKAEWINGKIVKETALIGKNGHKF